MRRALWLAALLATSCSREDRNSVTATGTLEVIEIDVAPMTTGRVLRMLVNDGDIVRAGDTLAILSQPTAQPEIEQREAQVEASRAGLSEAERGSRTAEINRAAAELRAAETEATRTAADANRARALQRAGAISLQQRQAAEAAARQAAAHREALRQSLLLLRQGTRPERIAGARAQVAVAQAGLSATKAIVGDLTLTAPVPGVVLSRNAEPGEIVTAGQSAVTLGEVRRPWVRVYVNAREIPSIKVGSAAKATLDGLPGRTFNGRVVAVNTKAEFTPRVALTEDERADMTFGVKIEFNDTSGALKPGLPVTVTIPKKAPSA
ncbi:MAG TPA: efflux RND transporter periplasmic adaptor subunit [Gemmatimonadaceae bacterium]|nr:efflux RND transporter periplasmic adaptor subunit [Gemmatimonadaceae bacterium]